MGLGLAMIYATNNIVTIDHINMLSRGYLAADLGIWSPFGNPSSGGMGSTPGYLSSFVVGFPLMIFRSNYSPIVFLLVLQVVAYLLMDNVVKTVFKAQWLRLVFAGLFWLNPWLLHETAIWNPSYLFLFGAMHLWSGLKMSQKKSIFYTVIHVMAIGLAVQLHFSALVLAIVSLFLFYKNLIKVDWAGFTFAAMLVIFSLGTFLIGAISDPSLIYSSTAVEKYYFGRSLIHVYPILKSMLYWLRYGSFYFSHQIVLFAQFEWIADSENLRMLAVYFWRGLVLLIGAGTVAISFTASYRAFRQIGSDFWRPGITRSNIENLGEGWLMHYSFCVFLAIVVCAILSPITFNAWHLIIVFGAALMPLLKLLNDNSDSLNALSRFRKWIGMVLICSYLILVNLVAAHDSYRFSYKVSFDQQVNEQLRGL